MPQQQGCGRKLPLLLQPDEVLLKVQPAEGLILRLALADEPHLRGGVRTKGDGDGGVLP